MRTSDDPKERRITIRISRSDLERLHDEAARTGITVGELVRRLIREHLPAPASLQVAEG